MLKSGTYKLPCDVKNPDPDRRHKHDWRAFPTWRAGWEFLVEDQHGEFGYTRIVLVGHRWNQHAIGPGQAEQYAALEAALIPCEESLESLFTTLRVHDWFARWLLESGKLDRDTFRTLWAEHQDGEPQISSDGFQIGRLLPQLVRATREETAREDGGGDAS